MASWRLAEGYVSFRWVAQHRGLSRHYILRLMDLGVIPCCKRGVLLANLDTLVEGEHYIVCAECGSPAGALNALHLEKCSGITLSEYTQRHAGKPVVCKVVEVERKKSEEQKLQQSQRLKARFLTPAGEVTRRQISEAAKASMASGYRDRAAEHLRALNADPKRRAALSEESKQRWASGRMDVVAKWHRENKAASNEAIAHARDHICRTFTKPHATLETALLAAGLSVHREYRVGFYRLDEALPEILLGIEMDGCYWHGCAKCGLPGVAGTSNHDRRKASYLRNRGWRVVKIRECELKRDLASCVACVLEAAQEVDYGRTA